VKRNREAVPDGRAPTSDVGLDPLNERGSRPACFARARSTVVLVTRNAAGQAQHIVANYRPRNTLLLVSRLIGEHFADSPYGEHFASSALE
jgi:hypothetical protein